MRPDAVNWTSKHGHVGTTFLPRSHGHREHARWIASALIVQALVGMLVLYMVRGPLRSQWEFDLGSTLSNTLNVEATGTAQALFEAGIAFLLGLIAAALVILPLVCVRLRRRARGLTELYRSIRALAQGAPPRPVSVQSTDDVAFLLTAFNDMAGKILAAQHKLIETNEELEQRVMQRTGELRSVNVELKQANENLAELTETALRFTDDVAHEFRTPLAVIMEFASLTSEGIAGEVNEKQEEFLQFIVNASKDLAHLVDDFLDSGKLRAKSLRVDRSAHSVEDIIESTWPMLETRAKARHITLESKIIPGLPTVYGDIEKVRRTFINLVMNAIKFSRAHGTVQLSVEVVGSNQVRFAVTDHGAGMTAEEVNGLFQRFRQTGSGRRSTAKGFGLGLSIVRDLVAVNLGSVSVESRPNEGSTFSFTLPIAEPNAIWQCHADRIRENDPQAAISALRIVSNDVEFDDLQSFIASTTYPTDVQLPCADDDRALIVFGVTSDPMAWRARLLKHFTAEQTNANHALTPELRIDPLITSTVADPEGRIVSIVSNTSLRENHHIAEINSDR